MRTSLAVAGIGARLSGGLTWVSGCGQLQDKTDQGTGKLPNIKSAKKRVKTNRRDEVRNRAAKSTLKSSIKTLVTMEGGDDQKKALRDVQSLVARTKKRGIIHKNKAARVQSRLAKRVNKAGAAKA